MRKFVKALACTMSLAMVLGAACAEEFVMPDESFNADAGCYYLLGDASKGEAGAFNDNPADVTKWVAAKFTIELDETEANDCATGGGTWVGGGLGRNSESSGWDGHEWTTKPYDFDEDGNPVDADGDGTPEPIKEITLTKVSDGVYEGLLVCEDGLFQDTDTYAQLWMQDWSTKNAKLVGVTLYTEVPSADETPDDTPAETPDDTPAETPDDAPETGDATSIVALALVAVVAMGGVVICSKKRA
ncbi:MAG: hypothetical protein ACI39R_06455 [Lachnospiraceae bacterium]